jgi:hypothetical protein
MKRMRVTPIFEPGVTDEIEGAVVNEVLGAATEAEKEAWEFWLDAVRKRPRVGTPAPAGEASLLAAGAAGPKVVEQQQPPTA